MESNIIKIKNNSNIHGLFETGVFAHKIKANTFIKKSGQIGR